MVVANRRVLVRLTDGVGTFFGAPSPVSQPASSIYTYTCASTVVNAFDDLGNIVVAVPSVQLMAAGWQILISALNGDGGDQFTTTRYVVEQWVNAKLIALHAHVHAEKEQRT